MSKNHQIKSSSKPLICAPLDGLDFKAQSIDKQRHDGGTNNCNVARRNVAVSPEIALIATLLYY